MQINKKLYLNNIKCLETKGIRIQNHTKNINIPSPIKTKNNLSTLKYQNLLIHSIYNPEKEAQNIIKSSNINKHANDNNIDFFFVIGLGYGYHIRELIKTLSKNNKSNIIIFEKSFEIFYSALLYSDMSYLAPPQVMLFVGEKQWTVFLNSFEKIENLKVTKTIFLQNEYKLFKESFDQLLFNINSILKQDMQNLLTTREFDRLWLACSIENSYNLSKHNDISLLENKFTGMPALVVSAGPSLASSITEIKKYKDLFFIIAVDTAMPTLVDAGIIPDFVIALDSQVYNFFDFTASDRHNKINVVYAISSYPAIARWNKNEENNFYFCALTDNEKTAIPPQNKNNKKSSFAKWLSTKLNVKISSIQTGASVSTIAIEFARLLRFSPINLVGQDMCYTNDISHAKNTAIYKNFLLTKTNKIDTLESLFFKTIQKRKASNITQNATQNATQDATQKYGDNIKVDFVLSNLVKWLGDYASLYQENDPILLINSSRGGLDILNIPREPLGVTIEKRKLETLHKEEIKENILSKTKLKTKEHKIDIILFSYIIYDLERALSRFVSFIKREQTQKIIQIDIILRAKKLIEDEFPFMKAILLMQADTYVSHTSTYINALLEKIDSILNRVRKLSRKLQKATE